MGRPFHGGRLAETKVDLSHQEMERIVDELDRMWEDFTRTEEGPTGIEWLPVEGVAHALCNDLGYEDMPEFEDAIGGSFVDLLDALPHVVKDVRADGRVYFQLKPTPPREEWQGVKLTLNVTKGDDLKRVLHKSPYATVEIPELEFEIKADGKRHVDTIYNHISGACLNLGLHAGPSSSRSGLSEDHREKILETVVWLQEYLDVPHPWTWIVHDPSGLSEFKPADGVQVERIQDA